jgi:hypothetical protein
MGGIAILPPDAVIVDLCRGRARCTPVGDPRARRLPSGGQRRKNLARRWIRFAQSSFANALLTNAIQLGHPGCHRITLLNHKGAAQGPFSLLDPPRQSEAGGASKPVRRRESVGGFDSRPPPQMACDLRKQVWKAGSRLLFHSSALRSVLATPVLQVTLGTRGVSTTALPKLASAPLRPLDVQPLKTYECGQRYQSVGRQLASPHAN